MSDSIFSEVRVFPVDNKKVMANGTVLVAGAVKVKLTLMQGSKGPFVTFPADKVEKNGEVNYYPHVKLITKPAVQELNELVLAAYNKETGKDVGPNSTNDSGASVDDLPF